MVLRVLTRAPGLAGSVAVVRKAEATNSSGSLDFVAEVFSGVELGRLDEGAEDGFDVAVGGEVGGGHTVDEGRGRVVGDEALGQFVTDEVRGVRIGGEEGEGLDTFVHACGEFVVAKPR